MIASMSLRRPFPSVLYSLYLLFFIAVQDLITSVRSLWIILEIPTKPEDFGKTAYLAVLLMIAFVISTFIMGLGGRLLGIGDIRIRMGISLTFFIFAFVTVVVFDNFKKRWG